MKILIISQHFWPETFRINETVQNLMEVGCDVTVLTGQPNYPDGKIFPGYRAFDWRRQEHPAGYIIHRVPLWPRGKSGAWRLIANYLSFVVAGALWGTWLLRRRSFDVIFIYGTSPILQALVGVVLKLTHRAKLVTWVQDLWPDSLVVTGYVRNKFALALVKSVVCWLYRRNDLLLVQSDAFAKAVRPMAGSTPVEVYPNPGERTFEVAPDTTATAITLPPGFNVVFAGNLGMVQALDAVVEAARRLRHISNVRIVLVGSGVRGAWVQERIAEEGLGNLVLAGRFPPEAMPGILAQASALLVSLARSDIMARTIPSKVQAYLAVGRPIIASLDGEGARIVEAAGAGVSCPAEDAGALVEAILKVRAMDQDARNMLGEAGRRYYARHFDTRTLAERLKQRFIDMLQSDHPPLIGRGATK